ncbi:hypothetical protein [Nonomuraea sp. NPDC049750]|uniref:hypothetical protein n=1 Tax=Nonomuraea sp. NPDC049750 TaxID=3154738 RepID=UPI003404512A
MSTRALIVEPSASSGVGFGEIADPIARPGQVLVEVLHVSLNYADLNNAQSGHVAAGAPLGLDAAGIVLPRAPGRTSSPPSDPSRAATASPTWVPMR